MLLRSPPGGFGGRAGAIAGMPGAPPPVRRTCAASAALARPCRAFIEHNSDPTKWRSPAKAEVKRRHPGVKLGSEFARIREQGAVEQRLVAADKFTDWNMVWLFAAGAAVLLVLLNVLMDTVEPNPPPEYTPYRPPSEGHEAGREA
ncbi:uncharacterized protein Tco025E_03495 [Trypanosoma conorhini]|uniref:Uncharacterized protein n=1 Tax=Trypanosoma conorhini TaxID=83891 RepID=A0A3R7L855_9TRYP|nr:uncharacterized protein Tco025E_03495 [Trypanosoma conorhini]RNF21714.1 hypothetical protein Tco025E_03495 [Trypanosoma conorhini]